jgi:DNA-binding GntR family transcriptional regulator
MKVKTYREQWVNYTRLFMGKGSYVQQASQQQSAAAKLQSFARPAAMQRHRIATNHL